MNWREEKEGKNVSLIDIAVQPLRALNKMCPVVCVKRKASCNSILFVHLLSITNICKATETAL